MVDTWFFWGLIDWSIWKDVAGFVVSGFSDFLHIPHLSRCGIIFEGIFPRSTWTVYMFFGWIFFAENILYVNSPPSSKSHASAGREFILKDFSETSDGLSICFSAGYCLAENIIISFEILSELTSASCELFLLHVAGLARNRFLDLALWIGNAPME